MIVTIESDVRNVKQIIFNNEKYTTRVSFKDLIPTNHDIVSIRLETIPPNLRKVNILLGYNRVGTIHTFLPGQNLLEKLFCDPQDILPVSKCYCMKKDIEFCYENDVTESTDPSTYYYEEEKNSRRVISEDIEEFYDIDEDEFRKGKQVLGYDTEIIQHLCFKSPKIVIETKMNDIGPTENAKHYEVKIWEFRTFYKDLYSVSEIMRYINDYELHLENGEYFFDKFQSLGNGGKLEGKMANLIKFSNGLANKSYHY